MPPRYPVQKIVNGYFGSNDGAVVHHELTPLAKHIAEIARRSIIASQPSATDTPELHPSERALFELVRATEEGANEELTEKERTAVVAHLIATFEDFDVLTPLVHNPEVNDIVVASYNDISVQTGRRNFQTGLSFSSAEAYKAFVEGLLKRVGKACTTATPVVDAALSNEVRLCVTHESFSPPPLGPMVTIRISRHKNITLDSLSLFQLAPRCVLDYLATVVRCGEGAVLIAGEVGTGKTTLLRALANEVDPEEAILVIEDTHEIQLNRPFVRTLLTREANTEGAGQISPARAIRTGLRMAMNRVILGEMRAADTAEAFIDVCSSGHSGLSTIHARSARDALSRLELFLIRAQGKIELDAIRKQIANAVSAVVYIRATGGTRRIAEIIEVETASDGSIQVSPIYRFGVRNALPGWHREAGISQFTESLTAAGVHLPQYGTVIPLDPPPSRPNPRVVNARSVNAHSVNGGPYA